MYATVTEKATLPQQLFPICCLRNPGSFHLLGLPSLNKDFQGHPGGSLTSSPVPSIHPDRHKDLGLGRAACGFSPELYLRGVRSAGFTLLLFGLITLHAVSFCKRQAALVCPSLPGFPLISQSQPCLLLHHWVLVFGYVILWPSLNQKVGRLAAWGLPFIVCHGFSCQLDRNLELSRKRDLPFKNCLNPTAGGSVCGDFLNC